MDNAERIAIIFDGQKWFNEVREILERLYFKRTHLEVSRSFLPVLEIRCQCGQTFTANEKYSAEVAHYNHTEEARINDALNALLAAKPAPCEICGTYHGSERPCPENRLKQREANLRRRVLAEAAQHPQVPYSIDLE